MAGAHPARRTDTLAAPPPALLKCRRSESDRLAHPALPSHSLLGKAGGSREEKRALLDSSARRGSSHVMAHQAATLSRCTVAAPQPQRQAPAGRPAPRCASQAPFAASSGSRVAQTSRRRGRLDVAASVQQWQAAAPPSGGGGKCSGRRHAGSAGGTQAAPPRPRAAQQWRTRSHSGDVAAAAAAAADGLHGHPDSGDRALHPTALTALCVALACPPPPCLPRARLCCLHALPAWSPCSRASSATCCMQLPLLLLQLLCRAHVALRPAPRPRLCRRRLPGHRHPGICGPAGLLPGRTRGARAAR